MTPAKPILALDPGTDQTAYIFWNGETIERMNTKPNLEVLSMLREFAPGHFHHLAVEMIASYGMPVGREVFENCLWIGRFIEAWARQEGSYELVYRLKVKQHLCHDSRAKDGNIRQALIDRFGEPGVKAKPGKLYGVSKHLWAALAVGVYAFDQREDEIQKSLPRHLQTHSCEREWVK